MSRPTYMAQCMNGHVWEIPHDTELERKAATRTDKLDAICVPCEECEQCHTDAQMRADADRERYGYSAQELINEFF